MRRTCKRCQQPKPLAHWYKGPSEVLRVLCRDCALVVQRLASERLAAHRRPRIDYAGPLSLRRLASRVEVHETDHQCGGGPVG